MFEKPTFNDTTKGLVLRTIITEDANDFEKIKEITNISSNALQRTLVELIDLEAISINENNKIDVTDEELIEQYLRYYFVSSKIGHDIFSVIRIFLDIFLVVGGILLFIFGIYLEGGGMIFFGVVFLLTIIGFEIYLLRQEKNRPLKQRKSIGDNEVFWNYYPINELITYESVNDVYPSNDPIFHTNYSSLQDFILAIPFLSSDEEQKQNFHYQEKDPQQQIDLVKWANSAKSNTVIIAFFKIQEEINDVKKSVNEIQQAIDYLLSSKNTIIKTTREKYIYAFLVLKFTADNIETIRKYEKVIYRSDIDAIIFADENKKWFYYTDGEKITFPVLNQLQTKKVTCFYCGYSIKKSTQVCPNCNKEVILCSVCKLPIAHEEITGECPYCNSLNHNVHLIEWVKTQGKCPACLQDLKNEDIIIK